MAGEIKQDETKSGVLLFDVMNIRYSLDIIMKQLQTRVRMNFL